MATGTIKANNTVDQTAGKTITLKYAGLVGYANDTNQPAVFCPFPFFAKNTDYTVSISKFTIDGVGNPSNLHVHFKNKTGVTIAGTSTMAYRNLFGVSNVEITVTFA